MVDSARVKSVVSSVAPRTGRLAESRARLLCSTGIVTTLALALMIGGAGPARADKTYKDSVATTTSDRMTTPAGVQTGTVTVTVNNGVAVTGAGAGVKGGALAQKAVFNNNGSVTSTVSGQNGVDVLGYSPLGVPFGSATYNGGSGSTVTGANTGINAVGISASVTINGALGSTTTVTGNNGNGINVSGSTTAGVTTTNTVVVGSSNGIRLDGSVNSANLTGGSVTGTTGDGILADGGALDVSASITTNGTNVTGGKNGISALSATTP